MKNLLVIGPDSSVCDSFDLATRIWTGRTIEKLHVPSTDYYNFDISGLGNYPRKEWQISISVNEFYINDVRRAFQNAIANLGYSFTSLVSPNAFVNSSASLGENSIIHAGCFIGANTKIGDYCVLRPNVVLSEDVCIGDFSTLEANVTVRELSNIGNFVTVCANSNLQRGTKIGNHSYLNISQQYSGEIYPCTFFSPSFPEKIQVLGTSHLNGHI